MEISYPAENILNTDHYKTGSSFTHETILYLEGYLVSLNKDKYKRNNYTYGASKRKKKKSDHSNQLQQYDIFLYLDVIRVPSVLFPSIETHFLFTQLRCNIMCRRKQMKYTGRPGVVRIINSMNSG